MHSLHKILVRLNGGHVPVADPEDSRSVKISAARSYAVSETECFYEDAYDWRETDTAGRWKADYPENVLLSAENLDRFLAELEECRKWQNADISYALQQLKDVGLNDLDTLVHTIQNSSDRMYYLAPYQLKCIGRLLDGEYFYGSHFYSTEGYTAKITESLIEEVKSSPDDWALVMFDLHY